MNRTSMVFLPLKSAFDTNPYIKKESA